jgi:hypothetical protein
MAVSSLNASPERKYGKRYAQLFAEKDRLEPLIRSIEAKEREPGFFSPTAGQTRDQLRKRLANVYSQMQAIRQQAAVQGPPAPKPVARWEPGLPIPRRTLNLPAPKPAPRDNFPALLRPDYGQIKPGRTAPAAASTTTKRVWKYRGKSFPFDPNTKLPFTLADFEEFLNSDGARTVRGKRGEAIDPIFAMREVTRITGIRDFPTRLSPEERTAREEMAAYSANGAVGVGKTIGFNKGQTDDQVPRGGARKDLFDRSHYKNGQWITSSQRKREWVNGATEDLTKWLGSRGVHPLVGGLVVDTVMAPFHLGAEINTVGDHEESLETRVGAGVNALLALGTSEIGGRLAAPLIRPLQSAAARLGTKAKGAIREFGTALWQDARRAVEVANRKLGIPLPEARKMVDEFRRGVDDLRKHRRDRASARRLLESKPTWKEEKQGLDTHLYSEHPDINVIDEPQLPPKTTWGPGKAEIIDLVIREQNGGKAFDDPLAYRLCLAFLRAVPENMLEKLEMQIVHRSVDKNGELRRGAYNWDTKMVTLGRATRAIVPQDIARTLAHEVAHHFQYFLSERDFAAVKKQHLREMERDVRNGGHYRYSSFSEWWAHTVQDHVDNTLYRQHPINDVSDPFMKALAKTRHAYDLAQISIARFFLRGGGRDHAIRAYKKMMKGKRTFLEDGPGAQQFIDDSINELPGASSFEIVGSR